MTGWPRSLLGRHALLIAGLMLVAQLTGIALTRELLVRPRYEALSDGLVRQIGAIRAGLLALPADQRQGFIDRFNQRAFAELPAAATSGQAAALLSPIERGFIRTVSERVAAEGGGEIVWRREAGGSLVVHLALDDAAYSVMLPGLLPAHEFTGAWLVASLGSTLIALIAALTILRRLHRPLAKAAGAARTLTDGATPPPLAEHGPTEVATLAAGFNHLVRGLGRAERERALMLAGISRDLRTPLTTLRQGVQILSAGNEPVPVAGMTRSVEEMDAIVGQFLDFARHDASAAATGDISALAHEIVAACASRGEVLTPSIAATPPVRMQRDALRRAIQSLLENALRHGRPPVRLNVGTLMGWVRIDVIDRGDGIPAADLAAMKQPFRRGTATPDAVPRSDSGLGLGLAIVERIVRGHGGRLELARADGGGLHASLLLPPAQG